MVRARRAVIAAGAALVSLHLAAVVYWGVQHRALPPWSPLGAAARLCADGDVPAR